MMSMTTPMRAALRHGHDNNTRRRIIMTMIVRLVVRLRCQRDTKANAKTTITGANAK
jgi:hypothetical protein